MRRNNENKKSIVWLLLFLCFLVAAIVGILVLMKQRENRNTANNTYDDMHNAVNTPTETDESSSPIVIPTEEVVDYSYSEELGIEIPVKNLNFEELQKINPDIYAWIYVPDTTVDYPILQHPTDNSYYLNYNLDGSYGYPGCIYTEDYNSKDFTDPHTVIYGHNLKDKTMFTTLHNFEDPELMKEDHYIFIYTEDYVYVYQIFAAYEYSSIHLLKNYDLSNEYVYEQFIHDIMNVDMTTMRVANVRHDIEVTRQDRIVTLSTCTADDVSSLRYLVTGVLLNPKQGD